MLTKDFICAGRAIFTVAIPETFRESVRVKYPHEEPPKPHYTFRVVRKDATDRWPEAWFVNLLSGPDNFRDYTAVGKLNPTTGVVALTRISKFTDDSWPVRIIRRVLAAIWAGQAEALTEASFEVYHAGRCCRCGRRLTVPKSILTGWGPECFGKN